MREFEDCPEARSTRSTKLTPAQARELRAWVRHGTRPPRPMTIWKLQRLGIADAQGRLTSQALVAVEEMERS